MQLVGKQFQARLFVRERDRAGKPSRAVFHISRTGVNGFLPYAPTVQSSSLRSAILCAVFLQNTTSTSHHHTIRHNVARHSHSPHDINHRHRLHASIVPSLPVPFNELPSQRHHTHQPRVTSA